MKKKNITTEVAVSARQVEPRNIVQEVQESYLDYAMSVIVARALPDVRDGLKPVQRRILYAMNELGLGYHAKHRKSATVVGEVLGKYHPHSDVAVYDALVRMAQDFSMRYPVINGQGNFGSIDGDSAAAMRYTEVRMMPMTQHLLADINKNTVNFINNYDATRQEPTVLPAGIPQLLLNGCVGIAVGMATNIPPHNLGEIVNGVIHLIEHPKADLEDLMQHIQGPDFPTGGIIFNKKDIQSTYASGRGGIVTRGEAEIIDPSPPAGGSLGTGAKKRRQIIITSIPYQVNKSTLIMRMADLIREKKIEGVADIRDESDKDGLRISIDLKENAHPKKILNGLYKYTDLEKTFHVNMVALVRGVEPHTLSLKAILEYFIDHRLEVMRRRSEFDLGRAKDRLHILEGLSKALTHIDAVIATIKKARDTAQAREELKKKFKLTDAQAQAILDIRLQQLAALERKKIEEELENKKEEVEYLSGLLADPKKMRALFIKELRAIHTEFADERKSKIQISAAREISIHDIVPDEETIIVLTTDGYIKRTSPALYRRQRRGGKGVIGVHTKDEEHVAQLLTTTAHTNIFFLSNTGKIYKIRAFEIPDAPTRSSRGRSLQNFLTLSASERIVTLVPEPKTDRPPAGGSSGSLLLLTRSGIIKRVELAQFENIRSSGIGAVKLKGDDQLIFAGCIQKNDGIMIVTTNGNGLFFKEGDVRPMGRQASGVRGIRLKKSDVVVSASIIPASSINTSSLLVMSEHGFGKRTPMKQYRTQKRGGVGIKTIKVTQKTGMLAGAAIITNENDLIIVSAEGQTLKIELSGVPLQSRATQGVRLIKLAPGDRVASMTAL